MDMLVLADPQKLTFISSIDTEYYLEDLLRKIANRNGWQEDVKVMHAVGIP